MRVGRRTFNGQKSQIASPTQKEFLLPAPSDFAPASSTTRPICRFLSKVRSCLLEKSQGFIESCSSRSFTKHRRSPSLQLQQILLIEYDKCWNRRISRNQFRQYLLNNEYGAESLDFWVTVETLKRQADRAITIATAVGRAPSTSSDAYARESITYRQIEKLIELYMLPGSSQEINIDDSLRRQVLSNLSRRSQSTTTNVHRTRRGNEFASTDHGKCADQSKEVRACECECERKGRCVCQEGEENLATADAVAMVRCLMPVQQAMFEILEAPFQHFLSQDSDSESDGRHWKCIVPCTFS